MDERKQTGETPDAGSIASEATVQVRSIISAAEGVADALKGEAVRRGELRVREAEGEAARLITIARQEADNLVNERRRRIGELSDLIVQRSEATLAGLEEAGGVKRQLQEVLVTLEETAGRLVRDAEAAGIEAAARVRAASATSEAPEAGAAPSTGPDSPAQSEPARSERAESKPAKSKPGEPTGPPAGGAEPGPNGDGAEPASAKKVGDDARPTAAKPDKSTADTGGGKDLDSFGGARQVAFQMAVAGSTRAEVAAHLQRVFELADPHPILNEVFGDEAEARK